jgi:hypothetical protein
MLLNEINVRKTEFVSYSIINALIKNNDIKSLKLILDSGMNIIKEPNGVYTQNIRFLDFSPEYYFEMLNVLYELFQDDLTKFIQSPPKYKRKSSYYGIKWMIEKNIKIETNAIDLLIYYPDTLLLRLLINNGYIPIKSDFKVFFNKSVPHDKITVEFCEIFLSNIKQRRITIPRVKLQLRTIKWLKNNNIITDSNARCLAKMHSGDIQSIMNWLQV